ncbi:hypothetical protein D3870_11975 [Noviherbaspirillum cavernae]|uniref:Uncharacterized protein n=1 Tax=Noviherbaspirillum cavernae TaxID=2320862 RepID=A0A418X2F7_9BURK|nr:hypothetical protein [Noviherbaspirillum cavernae]RJG06633.1 hypothetical protein D3870_11975 [Noviherbaspirillum cavernae]
MFPLSIQVVDFARSPQGLRAFLFCGGSILCHVFGVVTQQDTGLEIAAHIHAALILISLIIAFRIKDMAQLVPCYLQNYPQQMWASPHRCR